MSSTAGEVAQAFLNRLAKQLQLRLVGQAYDRSVIDEVQQHVQTELALFDQHHAPQPADEVSRLICSELITFLGFNGSGEDHLDVRAQLVKLMESVGSDGAITKDWVGLHNYLTFHPRLR